ncbi:MAG: tetratricopeptide repeat protein [Planctomycetota bacterium]|nr:tetratricopeptide repeat protein [Planctomycetota bacterium]
MGLLGQISAAVELLSGHLDRFPYDYDARLKLVDIYRSAGRDAEARRTLDEALLLSSDDPRALSRLGEMEHETLAAGYGAGGEPEPRIVRQELDPSPPLRRPPDDWEYLYFQIEDRLGNEGYMDRNVSFAIKIHSERAARNIRHLGLWLDPGLRKGVITRFEVVDGNRREAFTLPAASGPEDGPLEFHLPPLRRDAIVEAEISIPRDRPRILGDYFEQIVPLAQAAPVRLSRYLFTAPREARVFFHPLNGAPEAMVVTSRDGRRITHVWEINHPPAFAREADSPSRYGSVPCVQISSFADWNDFARWYWRFVGRQEAPPPELRRLADLAAAGGDGTPLNRLKLAAGWMARQIAHRDWASSLYAFRPLSARSILARMSADGKDRTLLLCLLAREYGLEAWPVLARLRDRSFAPGAASPVPRPLLDHFNHSLVMLDSGDGQSLLMDASNPYRPPEVLPSQLSGSLGLAVFPDSARILTLPDLGSAACEWRETSELTVDENGDASWRENILGAGTAAEILRFRFQNPETRARAWEAFLALQAGQPFEAAADFRDAPHSPDTAFFSGRSEFRRAATIQENRAILPVPGLPGPAAPGGGNQGFPLSLDDLSRRGRREQDLLLPHGFRISREIRIRHPEEWRPANPEPPFRREYAFGTISRTAEYSPGSLLIGLDLEVPVHLVAAGDYPDFREMAAFAKRWLNPVLVWETP